MHTLYEDENPVLKNKTIRKKKIIPIRYSQIISTKKFGKRLYN